MINNFDSYYGFLNGLMAGNYDITDVFCDATFKICGKDIPGFASVVTKLAKITEANGVTITFLASCEVEELPVELQKLVVNG